MQIADVMSPQTILFGAGFTAIGLMVKGVLKKQDKHDEKIEGLATSVTELRVTIIGIDGQNGLRGEVRDIKKDLAR